METNDEFIERFENGLITEDEGFFMDKKKFNKNLSDQSKRLAEMERRFRDF